MKHTNIYNAVKNLIDIGVELNNYEKFKMQSGGISSKKGWRKCLTDVLAADGAASGPIAPFTFIATIAAEAGLGSGYTYLTSGNC